LAVALSDGWRNIAIALKTIREIARAEIAWRDLAGTSKSMVDGTLTGFPEEYDAEALSG
jgi:RNase H-fold protein (predicted Holliday junction resolvase)